MTQEPMWPASKLVEITKSDVTTYAPHIRLIYVGTAGDVTVVSADDDEVTFVGVPAGQYVGPFFAKKVMSTGTTASNMVGFI